MRDYFFCSIKNLLLPHIKTKKKWICAREKYFVYLLCKNNVFFVSKIIFLCVCIQNEKSEFFEWHSTNIDDEHEVKEKKERKRRNILYFVHIQLQQSNFTKILSIAIRDTADRPKNRRKIKMTNNFITIFEILFVKWEK